MDHIAQVAPIAKQSLLSIRYSQKVSLENSQGHNRQFDWVPFLEISVNSNYLVIQYSEIIIIPD